MSVVRKYCLPDGGWPLTPSLTTVHNGCPTGFTGSVNRECGDGVWGEVRYDCDGDAILLKVDQVGAACHTGHYSCFFNPLLTLSGGRSSTMGAAIVQAVYDQVLDRKANPKEGSYTNKLLEKGVDKIGKKVVEEAAEVLIAAKNRSVEEVRFEVADLMYHLTVLLADQGMSWDDIYAELENRHR